VDWRAGRSGKIREVAIESSFAEIANLVVCVDQVASFVVNANHSIM
jgi:hypothetical protein